MIGSRGQRILLDRRLLAEPSAGHLKIAGLVSFSAGENKSNGCQARYPENNGRGKYDTAVPKS